MTIFTSNVRGTDSIVTSSTSGLLVLRKVISRKDDINKKLKKPKKLYNFQYFEYDSRVWNMMCDICKMIQYTIKGTRYERSKWESAIWYSSDFCLALITTKKGFSFWEVCEKVVVFWGSISFSDGFKSIDTLLLYHMLEKLAECELFNTKSFIVFSWCSCIKVCLA